VDERPLGHRVERELGAVFCEVKDVEAGRSLATCYTGALTSEEAAL